MVPSDSPCRPLDNVALAAANDDEFEPELSAVELHFVVHGPYTP